jgi:hypothetical protein
LKGPTRATSRVGGLYEPDAVLVFLPGEVTVGGRVIRQACQRLLAGRPRLTAGSLFHKGLVLGRVPSFPNVGETRAGHIGR